MHIKTRIGKKAQDEKFKMMKNTIDSVYVLYVLSTGLIDDIEMCL